MRKTLVLIFGLAVVSVLAGCVTRSYTYVKERVDQEVVGNRGYLLGTPPPVEKKAPATTTRKMVAIEIELPPYSEPYPERDTDLWGNLGYVVGEPRERLGKPALPSLEKIEIEEVPIEGTAGEIGGEEEFIEYKVQKGDTLEKIAARSEIYGDYKKWTKIYKANRDKLKSPDRIYPGQILRIPR